MIKKIINDIKIEYRRRKIITSLMIITLVIAVLNFIKPSATSGILQYIGISIINFSLLTLILVIIWVIFIRKKGGLRW